MGEGHLELRAGHLGHHFQFSVKQESLTVNIY